MADVVQWMAAYERAWDTDDPADVAALFTEDAEYLTRPYAEAIRGRDAIVSWWIAEDEPAVPEFSWHPVAHDGDVAVVEGRTVYPGSRTYRNLWVIRFVGDRCRSFTEWWMVEPAPEADHG
jgi:ketosteroid isomerase-like protein